MLFSFLLCQLWLPLLLCFCVCCIVFWSVIWHIFQLMYVTHQLKPVISIANRIVGNACIAEVLYVCTCIYIFWRLCLLVLTMMPFQLFRLINTTQLDIQNCINFPVFCVCLSYLYNLRACVFGNWRLVIPITYPMKQIQ